MNAHLNSTIGSGFSRIFISLFTAGIFLCGIGCSSVNQEPFAKFSNAVKNTQTAMEATGSACQTYIQDDFLNQFIASGKDLKDLEIKPDSENITHPWSMPRYNPKNPNVLPTILQLKNNLTAIKTLNLFFYQYTDLLKTLADPSMVSADKFTALKNQVSATGKNAWAALNPNATSAEEATAVNSFLADLTADVWKNALKEKQIRFLRNTLERHQSAIKAYADHGATHVQILINIVTNHYQMRVEELETEWKKTGSEKKSVLKNMLTLNDQFINNLTVLTELQQAYQKIPSAYADLIHSLDDEENRLGALDDFYYFSQRLLITVGNSK